MIVRARPQKNPVPQETDRKAIVNAIVVACMTGTAQPVLLKENLIRKTRSKKYPITTTDYGEAWLRTTDAGLAFVRKRLRNCVL